MLPPPMRIVGWRLSDRKCKQQIIHNFFPLSLVPAVLLLSLPLFYCLMVWVCWRSGTVCILFRLLLCRIIIIMYRWAMKYPIYDIKFIYFVLFHLFDIYISLHFLFSFCLEFFWLSARRSSRIHCVYGASKWQGNKIWQPRSNSNGKINGKWYPTRQPLIFFATHRRNKNIFKLI